jgi:hypothetical protein
MTIRLHINTDPGRGPGRDFDRVASFSTTLNGSPIFSGLNNDWNDRSALTSPISSMDRLGKLIMFMWILIA